jgi:sigma-B regulation protein RsbU (phosphoserine phosphatase)
MTPALPLVMIVDDLPVNIELMASVLDGLADLVAATSGEQCLRLLSKGLKPDLILLDLMMPGMDGMEVCAQLSAHPDWSDIAVVCVTARSDPAQESLAFRSGIADFIHKPFSPEVARARVRLHLERQAQRRALAEARQKELSVAHQIQRALLFSALPDRLGSFSAAAFSEPSQGVDGDFHTFTRLGPDCFELLVGDVMGKGVSAALAGAGVTTQYRRALSGLLLDHRGAVPEVGDVVTAMQRDLHDQLSALDCFATLSLVRFDASAGRLSWVNAGHTPGLLARHGATRALVGSELPLGILADETYATRHCDLKPGDTVLLWSDGISEASDAAGDDYGDDRLAASLLRLSGAPPAEILDALLSDVRRHAHAATVPDDRTLICVRHDAVA